MRQQDIHIGKLDWASVLLYAVLVFLGWLNIYAAVYDEQVPKSIFDLSINSGIQLVWIATAVVLILLIMIIDFRFFESFSLIFYGIFIILLVLTPFLGKEINGQRAWFEIGAFRLQPAEFAKFATALALAKFMERPNVKLSEFKYQVQTVGLIMLPVLLILLQPDTGTAMVYSSFFIMLYREGLPQNYYIIGIAAVFVFILTIAVENSLAVLISIAAVGLLIILLGKKKTKRILFISFLTVFTMGISYSVDQVVEKLPPHQQNRIKVLFNPNIDPLGVGWNVTQSKIAIGSGGLTGKGYLEGTQTKYDFVPEQVTDFIFCTLGEEFGWFGSFVVISLFVLLLGRLLYLAERQRSRFARVYGYGVVSILFFHFAINIAMTIGLFPTIGIPLPFFSYGGSSLWSFTIMLFIFLKLDAHRIQVLGRMSAKP